MSYVFYYYYYFLYYLFINIHQMENQKQQCPICLEQLQENNYIRLECHHKFNGCLIDHITNQIKQASIIIKCPYEGCEREISYNNIRSIMKKSPDLLQLHEKFLLKYFKPNRSDEKLIECPKNKCQNKFLIWNNADYATCNACNFTFCTNCFRAVHHQLKCQDVKQNLQNYSQEFAKFLQQSLFKKCPSCKTPIEKSKGCNFMTCRSPVCKQNKIFFCYLCGVQLTKQEHYKHFIGNSPYNNRCINSERMLKKDPNFKLPNSVACPKCYSTNPNECSVIKNSKNQEAIIICKKCNISMCVCGGKVTDINFEYHSQSDCGGKPHRCLIF